MNDYRPALNGVDISAVGEKIEQAVKDHERRTSCDHVHPQYDVHHPEDHPENAIL